MKNFKKNHKIVIATILVLCLSASIAGCSYRTEIAPIDMTTDTLQLNQETEIPSLTQTLSVEDEPFNLICKYDTGNYPLSNWHITDAKTITMKVMTENLPNEYEVYIDHVHADILLKSTSPQVNGITQDTMDDSFHGYGQDGFFINNTTEYYNIFTIEGYTNQFYEMWGFVTGTYGTINASYSRLTETNLIANGTYAEKLAVVYDLSIKKPGSDKLYTKSVLSEVLIPVSQTVNYAQKDLWTDQYINGTESTNSIN